MANILVVDDYSDAAESMAMLLKHSGHDVQIAHDGFQAIEIARRQTPKFVLLDLGLPVLDGYEVASLLREQLGTSSTIIAVTGHGREQDRRRALAAGCDHYFLKPIDHGALMTLLSASGSSIHQEP